MCVARVCLLLLEVFETCVDCSENVAVVFGLGGAVRQPVKVAGVVCSSGTQLTAHPKPKQIGQDARQLKFSPVAFLFLRVGHIGTFVIRVPEWVTILRPR